MTTFIRSALLAVLFITLPLSASQPLRIGDQKQQLKTILTASGALQGIPYPIAFFEFPAAAPLGEALNAGALDVGLIGDAPFVFAAAAGRGIKAIIASQTTGIYGNAILVGKNSPIQTVADLKGKKLVTTRGSIGHYLTLVALEQAGLTPNDVELIFLLPGDARPLLDSGRADAWVVWGPYIAIAIADEHARILASSDDYYLSAGFIAATEKAIDNKAAQLQDFVERADKARQWALDNPEAFSAAISKVTGLPYELHLALERNTTVVQVPIDDKVIAELQQIADVYYRHKLLRRKLDVRNSFDTRFNPE
ncbi:ABC transporter substrate-binding protein [Chromatiaceae bacterium AAb-1]|nr:ABC transporter substrate-binding protein [Chromatiaceae bacterium AAb-1]